MPHHQTTEGRDHETVVAIPRNTLEASSSLAVLENGTLERISAGTLGRPQCCPLIPNSSQKMQRGDPSARGRALHPSQLSNADHINVFSLA